MRNMSFALTAEQIIQGTKTVTRRLGWLNLQPGDMIQPVNKCMGLKKGEKPIPLRGPLRVVSVRREPLIQMWLDPKNRDVESLLPYTGPYPERLMEAYRIDRRINRADAEGPELIAKVAEDD